MHMRVKGPMDLVNKKSELRKSVTNICKEQKLSLHINLLLMFGLGEKFNHGILVYMLLAFFLVENNIIENICKIIRMILMSMYFFETVAFLQYLQTLLLYKS